MDILNVGLFGTVKYMEAEKKTFWFCLISGWAGKVVLKVESGYTAEIKSPCSCYCQAAVMSTPSPPYPVPAGEGSMDATSGTQTEGAGGLLHMQLGSDLEGQ